MTELRRLLSEAHKADAAAFEVEAKQTFGHIGGKFSDNESDEVMRSEGSTKQALASSSRRLARDVWEEDVWEIHRTASRATEQAEMARGRAEAQRTINSVADSMRKDLGISKERKEDPIVKAWDAAAIAWEQVAAMA